MLTISIVLIVAYTIFIIYTVYKVIHTHTINKFVDQQNKELFKLNNKLLQEHTNLVNNINYCNNQLLTIQDQIKTMPVLKPQVKGAKTTLMTNCQTALA